MQIQNTGKCEGEQAREKRGRHKAVTSKTNTKKCSERTTKMAEEKTTSKRLEGEEGGEEGEAKGEE